jgi:Cu-Zn family superoxide dismutase
MLGESTIITAEISGLSPGHHGFHIHEKGDLSDGCKAAGPHYNPFARVAFFLFCTS